MKLLFALALVFCQSLACAQTFTKVFSSGNALFQYSTLGTRPDKGWVAAGSARDGSDFYALISGFDATGNLLWTKRPGFGREPKALVSLDNGDILLFNNNYGLNQYFDASVLQLDASGNFKTETVWGDPEDQDDWFDAKKMPDGSVVAVGMSRLSSDFIQRVMIARFSATGQVLWEKMYSAGELLALNRIVPVQSGGFFLLGDIYDFNKRGILIVRCSDNGNIIWSREYSRPDEEEVAIDGIPLDNDEMMVVSYLYSDNISVTTGRTCLLRLNANGAILGQTLINNEQGMAPVAIGKIGNDTLALAAVSTPVVFPPTDVDLIISTLTTDGNLTGSIAFGSDEQDYGYDAIFRNGEVIFCGLTDSSNTGIAQRGIISKANPRFSCCRKSVQVNILPPSSIPVPLDYELVPSQNTVKQNITDIMNATLLQESTVCQSFEGMAVLPADTAICTGETLVLKPVFDIPGTILWNTGANTPGISVTVPGEYSVTVNSECGLLRDTVLVTSKGTTPDIEVSSDTTICKGTIALLSASGGNSYSWLDKSGSVLSDKPNLATVPDESGVFTAVVSIGECSDSAQVFVTVLTPPVVSAVPDTLVSEGKPVVLNASGAQTYSWQPSSGLSCTDCPNPVLIAQESITYTVTGLDSDGCADSASVTVTVKKPCPFYIPNIFAPGSETGTGNDIFRVFGADIRPEGYLLRIYSRWGELVFESEDASAHWDGLFSGRPAPAGIYTYQIEMNTCDGTVQKSGDITLIR
jgi:gliding motility-associated-like protein